jgi:hypothetical protein
VPTYEFNFIRNRCIDGLDALNWFHCQSYSRKSLSYLFQQYNFKLVKSWLGNGDVNVLMQKTNYKIEELKNNNSLRWKKMELKFHKTVLANLHVLLNLPKKTIKYLIR